MPKTSKPDKKPLAVLISDVHMSPKTILIAGKCLSMALEKAETLGVRLIVCGDLHDTKSVLDARCVDMLLTIFREATIKPVILRGNHDSLDERSRLSALGFLSEYAILIEDPHQLLHYAIIEGVRFLPYMSDPEDFVGALAFTPEKDILIMHQGVKDVNSGDYIQDKSAVLKTDLAGRRVISGHYHTRQTIQLPNGGVLDYVGNPFTLTFGEANDPEKGFQILYDDGSLEFVPTKMRRHYIVDMDRLETHVAPKWDNNDILWVKIRGTTDYLSNNGR